MSPSSLLLVLLAAGRARAAEPVDPFSEPDEAELFRAEQRVVTVASRYAQTVDQAPSIVTVVTDSEIRARGYRTLSDVLREIPGIYVTVSKESRGLAWFRGVTSDDNNKFLLLVDGVPWYDGIYTHAFIDDYLPLVDVKQVEVIKGPGSAIYGTNAFAGVINVVTYGADDLQGGFARMAVGDDGRLGMAAVSADRIERGGRSIEVGAFARYLDRDGDGLDTTPKGRANVTGLDPHRAFNAGFRLRVGGFQARADLVDYRHTYFVNAQDDPFDVMLQSADEYALRYRNRFLSARYDLSLGPMGRFSPWLYAQRYDNPGTYAFLGDPETTLTGSGAETRFTGTLVQALKTSERYGAGVEVELHPLPTHTTVGGVGVEATHVVRLEDVYYVDFDPDPVSGGFRAEPAWIQDLYAFAQHTWTASWWLEATGGLRLDAHSYFGAFPSPRAGLLFVPAEGSAVKLLYGRAFRAPNARELLVEVDTDDAGNNLFTNGNPGLSPEVIDTIELEGSTRLPGGLHLRGAAFASTIDREITKTTEPDPALGDDYYTNRGGATVLGGEVEAGWKADALDLDASASFTDARDVDTGRPIYGFPPVMAHARATWTAADALRLSALLDVYSLRPRADWTPASGLGDGAPFALVHLAAATGPFAGGRLSADISVRNLLDTDYVELISLDDANATTVDEQGNTVAKYPDDIQGEGRTIVVGLEVRL